jgi:hypothetical protein
MLIREQQPGRSDLVRIGFTYRQYRYSRLHRPAEGADLKYRITTEQIAVSFDHIMINFFLKGSGKIRIVFVSMC